VPRRQGAAAPRARHLNASGEEVRELREREGSAPVRARKRACMLFISLRLKVYVYG
jgi:hypothetical protein